MEPCMLKPNSTITLIGFIDQKIAYTSTCALIQQSDKSSLSVNIDVTPSVFSFEPESFQSVDVQLSNVTTQTYVIPPKIQPVTIEEFKTLKEESKCRHSWIKYVFSDTTLFIYRRITTRCFTH